MIYSDTSLAVSTTSLGLAMLLCDNGHVYFPMRLKDSRDVQGARARVSSILQEVSSILHEVL